MKQIINTVLFGRRKSYIVGASLAVIGLYIGFLFWYLIANNWTQPTINILVLVICVLVAGNSLLALYKIPEQLCTNPYIEQLLNFPIKVSQIIYTVIFRLCKIQVLICVCFILPYMLFFNDEFSVITSCGLIGALFSMIFDCLIFLLMIGIPFTSKKFCGYIILVIQYGGFLLIIGLGAYWFIKYLTNPLLLWNISSWVQSYYMILCPILLLILFLGFVTVTRTSKTCYLKTYYYLLTFTKPVHSYKKNLFHNSPYFLVEWCRVTRNKELFFYSSIKSVVTVYLLGNILLKKIMETNSTVLNILDISLMILCCAINTISSTSYSSDKNIQYYKFFPINYARVFFAKVVVGFLWNEIIVGFIWIIISSIGNGLSFDISLLIFGTFTNLLTSAIGVYFDNKMPRNINGSNLLFHGNMNKIFVLLAIVGLTILEIYLLQKLKFSDILLGLSVINLIFNILLGTIFAFEKGGVIHDRG